MVFLSNSSRSEVRNACRYRTEQCFSPGTETFLRPNECITTIQTHDCSCISPAGVQKSLICWNVWKTGETWASMSILGYLQLPLKIRASFHSNNALKMEHFLCVFEKFCCQMIPVHTDPWKRLKTLYYACQASSWQPRHVCAHTWICNTDADYITLFTNVFVVYTETITVV